MPNVLVPNIIITDNFDVVTKISNSKYLSDVRSSLSSKDSVLIQSDSYVYELIHSLNYSEKNEAQRIRLKLYDVNGDLEDKLFNQSLFRTLAGAALDRVKQGIDSLSTADATVSKAANSFPTLYITYGVNDQLSHWCSPKIYSLTNAKLSVANNMLRAYEFEFMPAESPILRAGEVLNNSTISVLDSYLIKESFDAFIAVKRLEYTPNNIQKIVTNVIREYLFKAFTGSIPKDNIIVLLPKFIETVLDGPNFIDSVTRLFRPTDSTLSNLQKYFKIYTNDTAPTSITTNIRSGLPQDRWLEEDSNKRSKDYVIVGVASISDSTGEVIEDGGSAKVDLMEPLNLMAKGINAFQPSGAPIFSPTLIADSDLNFLTHLKEFNLIGDTKRPCVIFSDVQMVSDYIYYNQTPLKNGVFDKSYPESKYTISQNDDYYATLVANKEKYRSSSYFKKLSIGLTNHSSGFNEQVTLDELAKEHPREDLLTNVILNLTSEARSAGYPIFTSNLKNSNTLSYVINGSEAFYYKALATAIRDDKSAFVIDSFREEIVNGQGELLNKYGLDAAALQSLFNFTDAVDIGGLDPNIPEDVSRELVELYKKGRNFFSTYLNNPLYGNGRNLSAKAKEYLSVLSSPKVFELITIEDEQRINIREKIFRSYYKEFAAKGPVSEIPPEDILKLSKIFTAINNITKDKGSDILLELGNLNPNRIKARVLREMQEASFQITIKTLPMFHISSYRAIAQPCLFYSGKIKIQNSPREFDLLEYFSGEYVISGFNHVITSKDCYSEFLLLRIPQGKDLK